MLEMKVFEARLRARNDSISTNSPARNKEEVEAF
jgi:hypothetical protein